MFNCEPATVMGPLSVQNRTWKGNDFVQSEAFYYLLKFQYTLVFTLPATFVVYC